MNIIAPAYLIFGSPMAIACVVLCALGAIVFA